MKITKQTLSEIILEALTEVQPTPQATTTGQQAAAPAAKVSSRQKKVASAATSGAMMDAAQYGQMLKQVLLTPKVAPQTRKEALVSIFGPKGMTINSLVLQLLKGVQK